MALNIQMITTSTSVLFVNPTELKPAVPVVLLSSMNAYGRIMTVRDGDGGSLSNPIFVSTTQDIKFQDGITNLVKIQQPYGFVTFSALNSNTYNLLNIYAFPDATDTAYYKFLTAQMLGVSSISTNTLTAIGQVDFYDPVRFHSSVTAIQGLNSEASISTITLDVLGNTRLYNNTYVVGPVGVLCNSPRFNMDISGSFYTTNSFIQNAYISTSILSNSYIQNLSSVVTLASNLYVGSIPSLNPAFKLDVTGNARISTLSSYSLGVQGASFISSVTDVAVIRIANVDRLSNSMAQISSLGINTSTPAFRLDVAGNSRVSSLQGNLIATYAYVSSLGIQNTNPKYALDVRGGINATSTVQSLAMFTSSLTATVNGGPETVPRFLIGGEGGNTLGIVVGSTIIPVNQNIFAKVCGILHDGSRYVAGGVNSGGETVVATSRDGTVWEQSGPAITTMTTTNSFLYAKGQYIVAGSELWVSSDLVNWSSALFLPTGYQFTKLAFNEDTILAIGYHITGSPEPQTYVSQNGIAWTPGTILDTGFQPKDVAWNGFVWCMTGTCDGTVTPQFVFATSKDGVLWEKSTAYGFKGVDDDILYGGAIAWIGDRFIAGNGYTAGNDVTNKIALSIDGVSWTFIDGNLYRYTAIATNGTQTLAVGTSLGTSGFNSVYLMTDIGVFTTIDDTDVFFNNQGLCVFPISYTTDKVVTAVGKVVADTLSTIGPAEIQGRLQVGNALVANPFYKNVGVNCNAPAYTLDVGGTIHASTVAAETLIQTTTVSSGTVLASSIAIGLTPKTTSQFMLDVSGEAHFNKVYSEYGVETTYVSSTRIYGSSIILSQENTTLFNTPYQLDVQGSSRTQSLSSLFVSTGRVDLTRLTLFDEIQPLSFYASTNGLFFSADQQILTKNGPGETVLGVFFGSTVRGLGTANYISTLSLTSTVENLINASASTVTGLGTASYTSTLSLTSTVANLINASASTVTGLGTASYTSTLSLTSTVATLINASASTVTGLGTARYLSSLCNVSLISSLAGNFSSIAVGCNAPRFQVDINGSLNSLIIDSSLVSTQSVLTSSVRIFDGTTLYSLNALNSELYWNNAKIITSGGTSGGVVQSDLTSTVFGIGGSVASTVTGLGTAGFISSSGLTSTVRGLGAVGYVSSLSLGSTLVGLGTAGFISTSGLTSTVTGLGTAGFVSTTGFNANLTSTVFGIGGSVASTVTGLGSAGFVSTVGFNANLTSTVTGLGTAGFVSTAGFNVNLTSTVRGLGTAGYVSSLLRVTQISSLQGIFSSIGVGCNAPSYTLDVAGSTIATFNLNSAQYSMLIQVSTFSNNATLPSSNYITSQIALANKDFGPFLRTYGSGPYVDSIYMSFETCQSNSDSTPRSRLNIYPGTGRPQNLGYVEVLDQLNISTFGAGVSQGFQGPTSNGGLKLFGGSSENAIMIFDSNFSPATGNNGWVLGQSSNFSATSQSHFAISRCSNGSYTNKGILIHSNGYIDLNVPTGSMRFGCNVPFEGLCFGWNTIFSGQGRGEIIGCSGSTNASGAIDFYTKVASGATPDSSSNLTMTIAYQQVGINQPNPTVGMALDVTGNARKTVGGASWDTTSDRRIKENIIFANTDWCLSTIKNINLYSFNFTNEYISTTKETDKTQLGFIAQEVSSFFPKSVKTVSSFGIDDCLTLNISQIQMAQYGATKRLIERVESLEAEVDQLKSTLQAVLAKVTL